MIRFNIPKSIIFWNLMFILVSAITYFIDDYYFIVLYIFQCFLAIGIGVEHITEIENFKSNWLKYNFWVFLTVPIFGITIMFFCAWGISFLVKKVSVYIKKFNERLDK